MTSTTSNPSSDPLDEEFKDGKFISRVWHASLQVRDPKDKDPAPNPRAVDASPDFDPKEQMKGGWPACFSIRLNKPEQAKWIPFKTSYFTVSCNVEFELLCLEVLFSPHSHLVSLFNLQRSQPATSLGGVESLLEWRVSAEPTEDPALLRLSVGLEDIEDLKKDLRNALREISKMEKEGSLK